MLLRGTGAAPLRDAAAPGSFGYASQIRGGGRRLLVVAGGSGQTTVDISGRTIVGLVDAALAGRSSGDIVYAIPAVVADTLGVALDPPKPGVLPGAP